MAAGISALVLTPTALLLPLHLVGTVPTTLGLHVLLHTLVMLHTTTHLVISVTPIVPVLHPLVHTHGVHALILVPLLAAVTAAPLTLALVVLGVPATLIAPLLGLLLLLVASKLGKFGRLWTVAVIAAPAAPEVHATAPLHVASALSASLMHLAPHLASWSLRLRLLVMLLRWWLVLGLWLLWRFVLWRLVAASTSHVATHGSASAHHHTAHGRAHGAHWAHVWATSWHHSTSHGHTTHRTAPGEPHRVSTASHHHSSHRREASHVAAASHVATNASHSTSVGLLWFSITLFLGILF